MSRAIRPGMTSGGTTKLIQDTTTNRPEINIQVQSQIGNTVKLGNKELFGRPKIVP